MKMLHKKRKAAGKSRVLAGVIAVGVVAAMSTTATAQSEGLNSLQPVDSAALSSVAIGVANSVLTTSQVDSDATIKDNTISLDNGSTKTSGQIRNNVVTDTHGITTVVNNTGDMNNFNYSTIVNVYLDGLDVK